MPLYEYHCRRCDDTFEVIQKFSDQPLLVHEGCGGQVERLLSVSALQFKGSGWYVNDYGRGGKSNGSKGDVTKTDAKTETKPAAATVNKGEKGPAPTPKKD
jgi:putative FmdB family regulatory protein